MGNGLAARAALVGVLAACANHPAAADHAAAWRDDLAFVARELPARHVKPFFHITEAAWRARVAALDAKLPQLDDAHALAGLVAVVAALGDTHTLLGGWQTAGVYPLQLTWFDDGIFVVGADAAHAGAIGKQLVAIGDHPIADVITAITPMLAADSPAGLHARAPDFLIDAALLAGADVAPPGHAMFVLAAADGTKQSLALTPGLAPVPIAIPKPPPLHLTGPAYHYWNQYVAADRLLYLDYAACTEDPRAGPFAALAAGTLGFVDSHPVDRFVIDLRSNLGGDSTILEPLTAGFAARPALAGRVFVLIGMHTFSSAVVDAMDLKRRLHATLVGGPTDGKPSAYGEIKLLELPRSHLKLQYSTKRFDNPDFPGNALAPDIAVSVTSADWFAGRDPALAAVLAAPVHGP